MPTPDSRIARDATGDPIIRIRPPKPPLDPGSRKRRLRLSINRQIRPSNSTYLRRLIIRTTGTAPTRARPSRRRLVVGPRRAQFGPCGHIGVQRKDVISLGRVGRSRPQRQRSRITR